MLEEAGQNLETLVRQQGSRWSAIQDRVFYKRDGYVVRGTAPQGNSLRFIFEAVLYNEDELKSSWARRKRMQDVVESCR